VSADERQTPDIGESAGPDDELIIETTGIWEDPLDEGLDPHHADDLVVARCGKPRGKLKVYVHADALERIHGHVSGETKNEVGGVLVGHRYLCRNRPVTDVRDVLEAPSTQSGVSHVTFSHDTWAAILNKVDEDAKGSIVGWYHSHPGFGVFFSRQDTFIQENFFDSDGHVALVIDPIRSKIGAFTWQIRRGERSLRPAGGFWVTAGSQEPGRAEEMARRLGYEITRGGKKRRRWFFGLFGRSG